MPGLDQTKTLAQYAHRIWGQEEGLFQPTVYSILQTGDGFLWLGTQDSLIRFDGRHFREFADGASPLHGGLIRALARDSGGGLWAGSIGSGITRIAPDGSSRRFTAAGGLPSDTVVCLDADPRTGDIWACTSQGLARIRQGSIRAFSRSDGLPGNQIRATCSAPDGTRWVAGVDFGLSRFTGARFASYSDRNLRPGEPITALQCGSDGSIWVGKSSGLLQLRNGRSQLFTVQNGLPDNEVSALTEAPDGSVWVGTYSGISRLNHGEVSAYRVRDGLSHSLVLSLFVDREGTLWAGTKDGLDQFTDGNVTPFTTNQGLLSNDVGPVLEDGEDRLWIGTLGRGLNFFDGRRFHALTSANGLLSNTVISLALAPGGDLWVGTARGLNRIHEGTVIAAYSTANGLPGPAIRALYVDASGDLWAGTNRGLARREGNRFIPARVGPVSDPAALVALGGGPAAGVLASFEQPSLYLLARTGTTLIPADVTHPVDCFLPELGLHSTWMGTLGSGLLRWAGGRVAHVRVKDGLYDNRIYSLLRDDEGNLWVSSSKGIFRLNQAELDLVADGKGKSVVSLPFSTGQLRFECQAGVQPAACRTHDGRLWFSTTSGLVLIDPERLHRNRVPPPVSITALIANGRRLEPHQKLHLQPWITNNIEIRYAGLSFISPEKVAFRYMLDGYDKSWIDAGDRREAFYTNLPPGHFTFKVMARNADGVWSPQPAAAGFTVEPRLIQRWWFWPVLLFLLCLAVAASYRMRVRRLRQRFELILAERNRIARELHDTLLQGLSGITMQLQAIWTRLPASREKQFLGEVIQDAGRCSQEARQSLWGLRSGAGHSSDFSEKLLKLAHQAIDPTPLRLVSRVQPVALRDRPEVEFELLRIAQEAIANSLKHAGALSITLLLELKHRRTLQMRVEDDGVGFDGSAGSEFGHFGLSAMQERANEIGAQLSITAGALRGTVVEVLLPLSSSAEGESNEAAVSAHQIE